MHWRDLPGFFDYESFYDEVAAALPAGAVAVEVGVYMGRSLSFLASRLEELGKRAELWAVDLWDDQAVGMEPQGSMTRAMAARFGGNLYATFLNSLREQRLERVRHLRESSWEAAKAFEDASLDFVFIDAGHDRESVTRDLRAWLPKVKPSGMLAGHDYGHPLCPEVAPAVDAYLGEAVERRAGHVWVFRPDARPLVSVITPTHDRPTQLRRAVQSVRSQTYPRIEHIVVADGPQPCDLSAATAGSPSLKYVELADNWHARTGGGDWGATPRCVGTYFARGDYVAFLDDDNVYLPQHVEKLSDLLSRSGAGFVWSRLRRVRGIGGEPVGEVGDGTLRPGAIDTSSIMVRRELLQVANWRTSGYAADWDLVERWVAAGLTNRFLPEVTVHYDARR